LGVSSLLVLTLALAVALLLGVLIVRTGHYCVGYCVGIIESG
jgi:hypothetical protein